MRIYIAIYIIFVAHSPHQLQVHNMSTIYNTVNECAMHIHPSHELTIDCWRKSEVIHVCVHTGMSRTWHSCVRRVNLKVQ